MNEWVMLKKNIKKEVNYLSSLSFKAYFVKLFVSTSKTSLFNIIRFLTLYPFFKFFFDVFLFILKMVFNFYYIIFDRIFDFFKNLNLIIFSDGFFFKLNLRIINFFRYIFLFLFFVNINNDLKKKNIKFWVYIFEFFADIFIKIMRRRFNFRFSLYPVLKFMEASVLFIYMNSLIVSGFFDLFIMPLFRITFQRGYEVVRFSYRYYRVLFKYNSRGPFLFTDVSLFHISTMLQKNGFVAPVCEDKLEWYKAKLAYRAYRRKYLRAELTPDVVDKNALNIYIYLKDLLKDTRYQRKYIGVFDLLKVWFPYSIIIPLFFFLIHLFIGLIYVIFFLCFPIFIFFLILNCLHIIYQELHFLYVLCFKPIDNCLKEKRIEVRNERYKRKIQDFCAFYYEEYYKFYKYLLKLLKELKLFIKKVYEKIFR